MGICPSVQECRVHFRYGCSLLVQDCMVVLDVPALRQAASGGVLVGVDSKIGLKTCSGEKQGLRYNLHCHVWG